MKIDPRLRKKVRIRKKVSGTANKPRMTIYKSLKAIYVQLVDDVNNVTLCSASIKKNNITSGVELGKLIGEKAKNQQLTQVVFDRNGYNYHGVVKAVADSARENGLVF